MSIFEIGINDTLQDVIRKCNYNFRQITSSRQMINSETSADISGLIQDLENEIRNRINADDLINDKIDQMFDQSGKIDPSILPSDIINAYPINDATELSSGWLSLTQNGSALVPEEDKLYILLSASTSYLVNTIFKWSGSSYIALTNVYPIDSIYMSASPTNPSTILGGQWVNISTSTLPDIYIWKRTA